MVTFSCSQCNKKLKVPDNKVGVKVKCPGCATTIVVPADASGQSEGAPARGQDGITAKARPTPPAGTKTGGSGSDAAHKTRPDGRKRDKEDKKSSQAGLWIGLGGGGAVLCVAAVVAFLMLRGDKDKTNPVAATKPAAVEPRPERVVAAAPAVVPAVANVIPPAPDEKQKQREKQRQEEEALKLLAAPKAKPEAADIHQHVLKSSALLFVGSNEQILGSASGALVDRKNRLVLTNYHVVANSVKFAVFFPSYKNGKLLVSRTDYAEEYKKMQEKDVLWGKLLGYDQKRDLALLQLDRLPAGVRTIPFAAASARVGESVHSVGNPGTSGALWVYTPGTVRAVYRHKFTAVGIVPIEVDTTVVETTSAVNPGDSGGPLVNDQGELVGVTAGSIKDAQLVSYFIDINEALSFIEATCKSKSLAWTRDGQPLRATAKVDIADLIKYLEHPNPRVRSKAVELLTEIGPRAQLAIPALVKTLNDADEVIRRLAAKALENLTPDKADLAMLKASLQDKNDLVRAYAAGALGKLGAEARTAVPDLIKALADPLAVVRQNAAQSLGKAGARTKDKAVAALDKLLGDDEKEVRVAAADAIFQLLSPITMADLPLVSDEFLKHKDVEIRTFGARALGQLNAAEAAKILPMLIALCKGGTDKALRLAALGSVGQLGAAAKPAVPVLIEAVKDHDPEIHQAGCVALGKIGPEAKDAVPALAAALKEGDASARDAVIVALGEIGPEAAQTARALGKLLLDEKDREVRIRIVTTLAKFGTAAKVAAPDMVQAFAQKELDNEISTLAQAQSAQMRNAAGGQQPMPPGGQPPMPNDPNRKMDLQTVITLTLGKVDKGFQEKNAEALSKMGKAAVPALTNGLRNSSTLVRWGCIKALGLIGPHANNTNTLTQLAYWARFEPITQIKDEATSAGQKITADKIR